MYVFLKEDDVYFEYGYKVYYDEIEKKVVISYFWDDWKEEDIVIGLKSEVFLKVFGNKYYLDMILICFYVIEL